MQYLTILCLLLCCADASARNTESLPTMFVMQNGFETEPEQSVISYSVKLTHDVFTHSGDINDFHLFHYFNPSVTVDLDKAIGLPNSSFNLQALGLYDFNKPLHYEPVQGISNITGDNTIKLYQWSLQSGIPSMGMDIYIGLYDFNSEFDVRNSSGLFLNPSHGIGVDISQSGFAGPSIFPNPAFAVKVAKQLGEDVVVHAAIIDAVPGTSDDPYAATVKLDVNEGYLCAVECQITGAVKEFGSGYRSLSLGGWGYTKKSPLINTVSEKRNYGVYLSGEQSFSRQFIHGFTTAVFLRLGYADNEVNNISAYTGTGLLLMNEQEEAILQQAGISLAYGKLSSSFISLLNDAKSFELIAELTILFKPCPILSLQPDVQYVINPVGYESNTIFGGLRVILEID